MMKFGQIEVATENEFRDVDPTLLCNT